MKLKKQDNKSNNFEEDQKFRENVKIMKYEIKILKIYLEKK